MEKKPIISEVIVINWALNRIDNLSKHIKYVNPKDEFLDEVMTDVMHTTQIIRMAFDDLSLNHENIIELESRIKLLEDAHGNAQIGRDLYTKYWQENTKPWEENGTENK